MVVEIEIKLTYTHVYNTFGEIWILSYIKELIISILVVKSIYFSINILEKNSEL